MFSSVIRIIDNSSGSEYFFVQQKTAFIFLNLYALLWGAFAMTLVGAIRALILGRSLRHCEETLLIGIRTMLPALIVMILAWTVAAACESLETAEYITAITKGWMSPRVFPVVVFVVAALLSFATGTSWGTMAILTPIAVPIAWGAAQSSSDIAIVHLAIGATFSGSVLGDHVSPISDTTVMSSIFAGADHIAHVSTQIPYALVPGIISVVLYALSSFVTSPWLLILAGLAVQFVGKTPVKAI